MIPICPEIRRRLRSAPEGALGTGLWLRPSPTAGGVVGLEAADRVYGQGTDALADAAAAQDVVGLSIVAPLLILLLHRHPLGYATVVGRWLGPL